MSTPLTPILRRSARLSAARSHTPSVFSPLSRFFSSPPPPSDSDDAPDTSMLSPPPARDWQRPSSTLSPFPSLPLASSLPSRPPADPSSTARTWSIHRAALKRRFPEGWNPPKKLSRTAMVGLRQLHAHDPVRYSTPELAGLFKLSPEAVRRVLKSRWIPDEARAREQNRRAREEAVRRAVERQAGDLSVGRGARGEGVEGDIEEELGRLRGERERRKGAGSRRERGREEGGWGMRGRWGREVDGWE